MIHIQAILNNLSDLYATALQLRMNQRYLSALRAQAVDRLVAQGLDRERAALEVDQCTDAITRDINDFESL